MNETIKCDVPEQSLRLLGPHGGKQYKCQNYYVCGCDAANCENHAIVGMRANCFGPVYKPGEPKQCKKCEGLNEN